MQFFTSHAQFQTVHSTAAGPLTTALYSTEREGLQRTTPLFTIFTFIPARWTVYAKIDSWGILPHSTYKIFDAIKSLWCGLHWYWLSIVLQINHIAPPTCILKSTSSQCNQPNSLFLNCLKTGLLG